MIKYTVKALKNGFEEFEIAGLSQKEAIAEATAEAVANTDLQIFVVFADGYLNTDGHNPVGKAW